jgi:hypothetical protein
VITSLDDAWRWYQSAKSILQLMKLVGEKHWDRLPWDGTLGRDETLKYLESAEIVVRAEMALDDINDLCVLLQFSVLEVIVRDHVIEEIEAELPNLRHPAISHAVTERWDVIRHGSFFRVLDLYKGEDADLIEEVNQVRRYRNWVAHGRHGERPCVVDPESARERLQRFLARLANVIAKSS